MAFFAPDAFAVDAPADTPGDALDGAMSYPGGLDMVARSAKFDLSAPKVRTSRPVLPESAACWPFGTSVVVHALTIDAAATIATNCFGNLNISFPSINVITDFYKLPRGDSRRGFEFSCAGIP